jgi:hypothetical protein
MPDTIFPRSSDRLDERFDPFFKAVPEDYYRSSHADEDMSFDTVVEVTEALIDRLAEEHPDAEAPAVGFYGLHFDGDAEVFAYAYGDDESSALGDLLAMLQEQTFGEDPAVALDRGMQRF